MILTDGGLAVGSGNRFVMAGIGVAGLPKVIHVIADKRCVGSVLIDTLARPQAPWALRLLPPFPAIAQRILALASQEDVSVGQVAELIKLDPPFAAEILRFANSALFGVRREIASLSQAIVLMGTDRVTAMATCVAMQKMVRHTVSNPALRKVWHHSLVTALISEEIARAARRLQDSAYTAGLLHNLGTLGLMAAYPAEYTRMLEVSNTYGFDLLKTERDLFEIDHCAAGAYLAQDWDFPDELAAAIATHHDAPLKGPLTLELVTQISWRLADTVGYAAFSSDREWQYDELHSFLPAGHGSWLWESSAKAKEHLDTVIAASPI